MEEFIITTVKSLPRTLLVLMSISFLVLLGWLIVFVARRTSAILTAITTMLGKLEIAVEILKANQENNTQWLKRHDEEIRDLRTAKVKR
jgi:hypothetical protein